jgi:hypothetical protein
MLLGQGVRSERPDQDQRRTVERRWPDPRRTAWGCVMADRPDHDLADALDRRATRKAITRSYNIVPPSGPEDDDLDRAAAARLRQLTDEIADAVSAESVARAVAMSGIAAERDEYRRQLDTLRNAIEKLIPWAESYRMHHVVMALRELLALAAVGDPEDAVLSWLKGRSFGSIRVNEVTFALDQSADGQPLVRFTVTLDDPEPGQETWPFDDIQSMLRSIDDQAVAEGIESRWSTSFQQTSPEDFSTDDDLSEGAPW